MGLSKKSGSLLFVTGVIHTVVGVIKYSSVLVEIAKDGFINAISQSMERTIVFWFLFSGIVVMILGKLMQDFITLNNRTVPAYIGYWLLVLAIAGCFMMPISGFWLVLPQALLIIYADR